MTGERSGNWIEQSLGRRSSSVFLGSVLLMAVVGYGSAYSAENGRMGVMPPWKGNPNVMPSLDGLWSYIQARALGGLKPGRPDKL